MTSLTNRLRQHAQLHQQCTVQDDEQKTFADDLLAAAAENAALREQVRVLREALVMCSTAGDGLTLAQEAQIRAALGEAK